MSHILEILLSTLRMSTPLILAAMGGILSERSGVINIALEGMMLVGAFAAASTAYFFQGSGFAPELGLLAAIGVGAFFSGLYAFSVIQLKADQIVAGTAMNMLAAGATPFLCKILYGSTGATPALDLIDRFQWGPTYLAFFAVALLSFIFRFLPIGLWITFAGEHPQALESAGIRVKRVQWASVVCSGALAGIAGASLSICLSSSFTRNMTAGRGFMALAAMIFGKWRPIPSILACLLFGFAEAEQIRLQGVVLWGTEPVPVQVIQILPYLLTVLILAGWVGKASAPKALGSTH